MTKQEYEIVKALDKIGYDSLLSLGPEGYLLKVKRRLNGSAEKGDKSWLDESAIDSLQPIAFAQKAGYKLKGINVEEYEKGTIDKLVPKMLFTKQYDG